MPKYWVGLDNNWHDAANWSLTSGGAGGAGGAGIPTAIDDVFFDGNGFVTCQPTLNIVCNNMSLLLGMTEMLLIDASAIINGDFLIEDGYFGPSGGPNHIVEFKGNWLNTGGTFAIGTGVGKDPECIFSGVGKTYNLNQLSAATFQNVLVSGEVIFSGTRLGIMNISQKLSITGIMTINKNGTLICDIELSGINAGFDVFTGTLNGTGRFWYTYRESSIMPTTGTININYFKFRLKDGLVNGPIDVDLITDGWSSVHQDWVHYGVEPWLHDDEGVNYISLSAEAGSVGKYDEHYSLGNIDEDYASINLTKVKVHLKGKLYDGVGGRATLISVRGYLWDGAVWLDAGTAFFLSTSYADRTCSISLHASFDTLIKINEMKLKLEVDQIISGGTDKGGLDITYAYVEIEGTAYWNPIMVLAARAWERYCTIEIEYSDTDQIFRLAAGKHYFGKLTIHGNDVTILVAEFDCAENNAEIWCNGKFDIYKNAFPMATFTLKFGNGIHIFRGTIDFYFSYASANAHLVVIPGQSTLLLWPLGRQLIPKIP